MQRAALRLIVDDPTHRQGSLLRHTAEIHLAAVGHHAARRIAALLLLDQPRTGAKR